MRIVWSFSTYVAVYATDAKDDETQWSTVSEVVDTFNAMGEENANAATGVPSIKAFASLDEMMSAIKRDYGTDIKEITSYVDEDTKGNPATMLKIETFANLNDAVDLSLHVGADSSSDNKINMNIAHMSARGLGVNGLRVDGDTADNATKAIDTIGDALQKVSNVRASLGAVQNRPDRRCWHSLTRPIRAYCPYLDNRIRVHKIIDYCEGKMADAATGICYLPRKKSGERLAFRFF